MASRLILNGLRSIEECIRRNPERVASLLVAPGKHPPRIAALCEQARKQGVRIETNPKASQAGADEPLLAILHDYKYSDFNELVAELRESIEQGGRPIVLALDGITDPQNLGAILRTAAFVGVAGVVLPKDRSAMINETVYRVASGGLEHLRVAQVTNLVSALRELKEAGFWSVGFSESASQTIDQVRSDFAPVIVIGSEEKGMRPLVRENCDFLARLAGKGSLQTLNASVAAALAMTWASGLFSKRS